MLFSPSLTNAKPAGTSSVHFLCWYFSFKFLSAGDTFSADVLSLSLVIFRFGSSSSCSLYISLRYPPGNLMLKSVYYKGHFFSLPTRLTYPSIETFPNTASHSPLYFSASITKTFALFDEIYRDKMLRNINDLVVL